MSSYATCCHQIVIMYCLLDEQCHGTPLLTTALKIRKFSILYLASFLSNSQITVAAQRSSEPKQPNPKSARVSHF
jgi:hypothetical protein